MVAWDQIAIGLVGAVSATAGARYLKRRMDLAVGLDAMGLAVTLMLANILQLVGVVIVLTGLIE